MSLTILGLMQCQWFKDPDKVRRMIDNTPLERRAKLRSYLIEYALFAGCKSGRVLKSTLGAKLCEQITWEESTKEIGGVSSAVFQPDSLHIRDVIMQVRPNVIVTFGVVARAGALEALSRTVYAGMNIDLVNAPHPAARHSTVMQELKDVRVILDHKNQKHETLNSL